MIRLRSLLSSGVNQSSNQNTIDSITLLLAELEAIASFDECLANTSLSALIYNTLKKIEAESETCNMTFLVKIQYYFDTIDDYNLNA
jgi:hypothetical protein